MWFCFFRRVLCLAAVLITLSLTTSLNAGDLPGKGVTVQPARATWTTGFFLEALYSRALEELGYTVEKAQDLAVPIFYQSVCQGDVDFWANSWFPLQNVQLPKNFDEKAEIAGYVIKAGALQGYLASKKDVEKFGITSLDDFKRPEVKEAFDSDGDGKAELVGCPPGWGCELANNFHMEVYGLEEHIHLIKAGYSAGMADALARYQSGKPILFYTWTPNWTIYKLKPGKDVLWINVPEIIARESEKEFKDKMTMSGVDGAVTDPIKMGYPANDICVVANKEFLQANPAAGKMFEIMSVPLQDVAAQNVKMNQGENKQKDIERHVDEWIAANQDLWDSWLEQGRNAAQ